MRRIIMPPVGIFDVKKCHACVSFTYVRNEWSFGKKITTRMPSFVRRFGKKTNFFTNAFPLYVVFFEVRPLWSFRSQISTNFWACFH